MRQQNVRVIRDEADEAARVMAERFRLEQVLVKGHKGYVLMTHAGPDAVLTALCKPNARLGLIFLDVKRAADAISKVI